MAFIRTLTLTQSLAIVLLGMLVVIGSALGFEHLGGYVPCALCLEQRTPYYLAIPFLALGVVSALAKWSTCIGRAMLAIGLCCLVATALLGIYHSGVEWGIFAAPQSCGAGISGAASDAGSLLESLADSVPPSCDEAAGRLLGISFANANVIAAVVLAIIASIGLMQKTKPETA